MGLFTDIRKFPDTVRSLNKLVDIMNSGKNTSALPTSDFFDTVTPGMLSTISEIQGLTDSEVSPRDIYDMIFKDTYYTSLFEQLIEALFKNDFYIRVKKDEDGNLLGSTRLATFYEDKLKSINYEEKIQRLVYGERADGGGNVLLFTVKGKKGLEFRVEPFLDDGVPRVRVIGDDKKKKILRYEVVDPKGEIVYTIHPETNYYKHVRYSQGGNYRFSNNPAKRAVYWYVLKKFIAGANLAEFKHGFQEPVIGTPDYSALTDLMNAMGGNQVAGKQKKEYLNDPIKFLGRQSVLDDEILREITGDPRKSNMFLKLKMPYKFQKIGRNNQSMRAIELINLCDIQMGYALRTSKGVLNTMDSKYANAEVEKDNWSDFVLDPLKRKIERITQDFFLPALDPSYNSSIYEVRFGRDPDAEDIEVFNAQTARLQTKADVLQKVSTIPNVEIPRFKYNFYTNDLEPIDEEKKEVGEETVIVQEAEGDRHSHSHNHSHRQKKKTKSITDEAVDSKDADKMSDFLRKAFKRQMQDYIQKLASYNSIEEARVNIAQDIKPISSYGVNVANYKDQIKKFARLGVNEFFQSSYQRGINDPFEYPKYLEDLLDTKAQIIVKGNEGIDAEKLELIQYVYGRNFENYKGLDQEATSRIDIILREALTDGVGVDTVTKDIAQIFKTGKEQAIINNLEDIYNNIKKNGIDKYDAIFDLMQLRDDLEFVGVDRKLIAKIDKITALIEKENADGGDVGRAVSKLKTQLDNYALNRAELIARTEPAQTIEASRFMMYKSHGYDEKRWYTVGDDRVRPAHTQNSFEGWIDIDEEFQNGALSPADEIACRCSLTYRRRNGIIPAIDFNSKYWDITGRDLNLTTHEINAINRTNALLKYFPDSELGAEFDPRTFTINLSKGSIERDSIFHELGHLIDFQFKGKKFSSGNPFLDVIFNNGSLTEEGIKVILKRGERIDSELDIIEYITKGDIEGLSDSDKKFAEKMKDYYTSKEEMFAEGYKIYRNNPEERANMPELFNYFDKDVAL